MDDKFLKIVMLGLENAGKTSIIYALRREFEALSQVKPTKGIKRDEFDIFGQKVFFWDYGGQHKYRQNYLGDQEKYLSNINVLYYVVDIQDPEKILESKDYFVRLFNLIHENNPDVKVAFIFHKWDPAETFRDKKVVTYEKRTKKFEESKQSFLEPAIKEVKLEEPAYLFETTIFNPLSITRAISKPLFENQNLHKRTSQILEQFCKKYGFQFGFVSLTNNFEMGSFMEKEVSAFSLNEDLNEFIENNKRSLIETPFFREKINKHTFAASRFLLRERGMFFIILLIVGSKQKAQNKDKEHKKAILEAVDELKKLYESIGVDDYEFF